MSKKEHFSMLKRIAFTGIGPENAAEVVQAINRVREGNFWIDMETRIRTEDRFDVEKCRAVCQQLAEAKFVTI